MTAVAIDERPSAQSGPETDDGHPALRGPSVAARDDRIQGDNGAGPDCADGQLAMFAPTRRSTYKDAA